MQKQWVERAFRRASSSYADRAVAQQQVVERLMELIPKDIFARDSGRLLEFGCGSGFLTKQLSSKFMGWQGVINDLSPSWQLAIEPFLPNEGWHFEVGDAECFPFEGDFDLIVSSSVMQWFHDPALFLVRAMNRLSPNGILCVTTFGTRNLHEIRTLTGSGLEYRTIDQLCHDLQSECVVSGFEEEIKMWFDSPLEVLRHLRTTGVNGLPSEVWSKGRLDDFSARYRAMFGNFDSVSLTYHPIYLMIRRK